MDMHIHDVDMARFLFGEPQAVSCVAYDGISRWAIENTRMTYPDLTVVINGSWAETRGTPFVGTFYAVFEKAALYTKQGKLFLHQKDAEEAIEVSLEGIDMYSAEIEYFANTVLYDLSNDVNPPESAAASVKVVEALRESAALGGERLAYATHDSV